MLKELKAFLLRGNVVDLAVAVDYRGCIWSHRDITC